MYRLRTSFAAVALAASNFILAGCNTQADKIGDISSQPSTFEHKDVKIGGQVTKVYDMPSAISRVSAYCITDGTGQIWVLSHSGVPRKGEIVGVRGEVQTKEDLGGTSIGRVIVEKQREIE